MRSTRVLPARRVVRQEISEVSPVVGVGVLVYKDEASSVEDQHLFL